MLDKCLKTPVSEHYFKANMLEGPKHCWNLHVTVFIIILITLREVGLELTHWQPMASFSLE